MNDIFEYLKTYGSLDFDEKPFNEIDALIFSQLIYTDFKGIAEGAKKVFLSDAAMKFYSLHTDGEIENLIGISVKSARLLTECAKTKRFGRVALSFYVNNVNDAIDKQFSSINFTLSNDSLVVAYRGTDATVTGIKESAMLSYMFPVPAQIEALYYFQETAMLNGGSIRICGHSKGGNLAVFAGVNCSNSLKKRIDGIYEFDAPGFPKYFFERYDFKQIESKIHLFTPQSSVIGRMLCQDLSPTYVQSTNIGLKQHQVSSWKIKNDKFVLSDGYDSFSNMLSEYINKMIDYVGDDDLELFFNTIEYVLENMGIDDFYDLKGFEIKKAVGLINSRSTLSENQKERFNLIIKNISSDFTKDYISSKARNYLNRFRLDTNDIKKD